MEQPRQSLYLFQGTITLTSALHVGGGTLNTTNTDNPVVRTPDGTPYIPGSSFKGAFRTTVEKLASALPNLKTCSLRSGKDCFHREFMEKSEGGKSRYELIKDKVKEAADESKDPSKTRAELEEELLFDTIIEDICDTCQLFGNGFTASKIFFSDLELADWAEVTQVRDGVVIDRDSEKAVEGLKYDFEVVPADATFRFEIRLENPGRKDGVEVDVGLTCLGLHEFLSGLGHLGGNRSRGLGNCTMKLYKVYHVDLTDPIHLKRYLLHTKLEEKMEEIPDPETFVRNSIAVLI
jgi:CRISPR-associated RAMP protein (TIGR02581 family)